MAVRRKRVMPRPMRALPPLAASRGPNRVQAVLAAWRGVDLSEEEKAAESGARSLGDLMPATLERLGLERKRVEAQVLVAWREQMPPDVQRHSQPVGLAKGTLFVQVDSNAWLYEINQFHRREILARLQHTFGPGLIRKISFRLG